MSVEFFLDSNILVYQASSQNSQKASIAEKLVIDAAKGIGAISYQVVQETMNVLLRKNLLPVGDEKATLYLHNVLVPLCKVHYSSALLSSALEVRSRYQYSFYDSLIIAAALAADCKVLYSEDLQDGQVIDGLAIKNPFTLA
jgi:predicted nucleic acid-binding protein